MCDWASTSSARHMGLTSTVKAWVHLQNGPMSGLSCHYWTDNKGDGNIPEKGFFGYYGKDELSDIPWWLEEVAKAKAFDGASTRTEASPAQVAPRAKAETVTANASGRRSMRGESSRMPSA
jgi:hypothetical protein